MRNKGQWQTTGSFLMNNILHYLYSFVNSTYNIYCWLLHEITFFSFVENIHDSFYNDKTNLAWFPLAQEWYFFLVMMSDTKQLFFFFLFLFNIIIEGIFSKHIVYNTSWGILIVLFQFNGKTLTIAFFLLLLIVR